MYSKTKHSKEAWTLISYLTGKAGMTQWVNLGGYLPARKSVKAPAGTSVFVKGVKYSHAWSFPPGFSKANDAITTDLTKVFKNQMSTNDAVKDMQSQAQSALTAAP